MKFPDAATRYGSWRDREAGDIEWGYGWGWLLIVTASIWIMGLGFKAMLS